MRSTRRRWPLALALIASMAVGVYFARRRAPDAIEDDGATATARDVKPVGPPAPLPPIPLAAGGKPTPNPSAARSTDATSGASTPKTAIPRDPTIPPVIDSTRGVVRDLDGKPVPDLALVAVPDAGRFGEALFGAQRIFRTNGAEPRRSVDASASKATTAADGSFPLPSTYFNDESNTGVAPSSPEWMMPAASSASIGELVVERAAWLAVRIVSDGDGSPVAKIDARVGAEHRGDEGFTATDGGFVVQWPRGGRYEAEINATVIVAAAGFEPETREVKIPAAQASEQIEIRLKRVNVPGTLVVRLIDPPEGLAERPFDLEIRSPAHPEMNVDRRRVTRAADGTLSVEVPAGSWHVRLRPADGWANYTGWDQDVAIVAGQTANYTWRVPPAGTIRIHVKDSESRVTWLVLSPVDGSSGASMTPIASIHEQTTVSHVPVGRWNVVTLSKDMRAIAQATVDVKSGETAVAALAAASDVSPTAGGAGK
jgi:hypothetical protein